MVILPDVLMGIVVVAPLLATLVLWGSNDPLSQRHHLHHDTFEVSGVVARTQLLVMVFMGVLGFLTGWLCHLGAFATDSVVPLTFFALFQLVVLAAFITVSRWQVIAYDDQLYVRPFLGSSYVVHYDDIVGMARTPAWYSPLFKNLRIDLADGRHVQISGLLDIDRVLLRINRFDVLAG